MGKPLARVKGQGRRPKINTSENRPLLKRMFDHKRKSSLRKAAKKLNCSHKTIWNILKNMKKPILCYKRKRRPNRTPIQRLVARPKCRKLLEKYRRHNFILDDESYFTLSNSTLTGNDSYYSSDRKITPDTVN